MAPEDWTEDMIRSAAAWWIDWKCHACKEFGHAKYVCDAPAVRQRLDAIQLELRPSLAHDRSKAKALQGAFHASHTHITQVNPSLVSPERFNQQMNQVAKAMNPKPKLKTPPKSPPRTTPPPVPNPPQWPPARSGSRNPKTVTIKDKPTMIPSSGPITRSHAQRDLGAQFNAFLHAVELAEKAPEETEEITEEQIAALSEPETDNEVQYDSEPAEDDAPEGVPEEDAGEVANLSAARVPTDTELEAINHSLFPIRIHGHASRTLYDTGATHSIISKVLYNTLQDPPELIPTRCSLQVGNGESLMLAGEVTLGFTLGPQHFSARFLVSPHLIHPVILGTDFQRIGAVCLVYKKGKAHLVFLKQPKHTPTLAALVVGDPKAVRRLHLKERTRFPCNAVVVAWTQTMPQELPSDPYLDVEPTRQFLQECPSLEMIPAVHRPCGLTQVSAVPVTIINRSSRDIVLPMGYHLASLMTPRVEADVTHVPFAQCASLPTCPTTADQETDGQIATLMSTQLLDIHEPEWDLPSAEPESGPDVEDLPDLEEIPDLPEKDKEALIVPVHKCVQFLGAVLNIPVESTGEAVVPVKCVAIGSDSRLPSDPQGTSMMTSPEHTPKCERPPLADCFCTPSQLECFDQLCAEYADIFSTNHLDVGHTCLIEVDIDTGDSPPIAQAPYCVALRHVDWLRDELTKLEEAGVIEQCISPWASPIVIVPKKTIPGHPPEKRMCVDYRALNALLPQVTNPTTKAKGVLTFVPLPRIDDLLGQLRGTTVFSALDVTMGYHHMGLTPEAQQKTAFTTPLGKFKFNKCPFGLAQAPAYFQSLIFRVLQGLNFTFAYLDDVLIYSKNVDTHLGHLRQVFERFRQADLHLKKVKCDFFKKELQYLGHILSPDEIRPLPDKLSAIHDLPRPTSATEVRQFLGLTGYYRKFVPHYSTTTKPLSCLTKKDLPFEWDAAAEKAFCLLHDLLQEPPILIYPDPTKPYILFTDASKVAWGAVLMQEKEDVSPTAVVTALPQLPDAKTTNPKDLLCAAQEICTTRDKAKAERHLHPITFCSEQFQGSQVNWAALTKEAYAIFHSLHKLCFYTKDAEVTNMSDHLPLKRFLQKNTASAIVNNWAISLEEFRLMFEYVPGKCNLLADAMSRLVAQDLAEIPEPEPFGYEFGKFLFEPTPESQKYKKAKEYQPTLQAFTHGVKYLP